MRLIVSTAVVALACLPAVAQDAAPRTRQPRAAPPVAKPEPRAAIGGGFECKATRVQVSNLRTQGPSPVAFPPIYARPFAGGCAEAETRAKAIPSQDTNYVILGRTSPVEMAAGLCQSGAGDRTYSRSDLKPSRAGLVRPPTKDVKETVTITKANKYTLSGTGSGFSYTLSGTCKPTQPAS